MTDRAPGHRKLNVTILPVATLSRVTEPSKGYSRRAWRPYPSESAQTGVGQALPEMYAVKGRRRVRLLPAKMSAPRFSSSEDISPQLAAKDPKQVSYTRRLGSTLHRGEKSAPLTGACVVSHYSTARRSFSTFDQSRLPSLRYTPLAWEIARAFSRGRATRMKFARTLTGRTLLRYCSLQLIESNTSPPGEEMTFIPAEIVFLQ